MSDPVEHLSIFAQLLLSNDSVRHPPPYAPLHPPHSHSHPPSLIPPLSPPPHSSLTQFPLAHHSLSRLFPPSYRSYPPHSPPLPSSFSLSPLQVVVETAADLLRSLVEFNIAVNTKLYLTGAFYFACRYTGNNFVPLARLFEVTHVQQSFHDFSDGAASLSQSYLPLNMKSFLGNMLPAAVVNILINYGAERFSNVFTGEFDLPEAIWNAQLRMHLVEMIDQHIGDFPARLRQFTLARYDFCPIPKIHYAALNKEIYVYEYYLRNFCDEVRFPDWPVGEPLVFLRETLQRWREEMSKGVKDTTVDAAKKLLGKLSWR